MEILNIIKLCCQQYGWGANLKKKKKKKKREDFSMGVIALGIQLLLIQL